MVSENNQESMQTRGSALILQCLEATPPI